MRPLGLAGLLTAGLLIAMTVLTVAQVFNRYVLGAPLSWPEEVSAWLFVWLSFIGMSFGRRHGAFISIDIFTKWLLPRHTSAVTVFADLCTLMCFGLFAYGAYLYLAAAVSVGQLTPVTRLPAAIPKLAPVLGSLILIAAVLRELILRARGRTNTRSPE